MNGGRFSTRDESDPFVDLVTILCLLLLLRRLSLDLVNDSVKESSATVPVLIDRSAALDFTCVA